MASARCEFDRNGLMPRIQALIAPPATDKPSAKCNGRKRVKKSGENGASNISVNSQKCNSQLAANGDIGPWSNHEFCDFCHEGGDVLCCDRCPAAFHLQCNEPPLEEDEIPEGEYFCKRCRAFDEIEKGVTSAHGEVMTNVEDPVLPLSQDALVEGCDEVSMNSVLDAQDISSPFELLIKAASMSNPRQFQLPNELTSNTPIPGTSKKPSTSKRKLPHELDNGLVQHPLKLCFVCNQSCRKAALVQCDFCSLLYHADCLDPPLTALPTHRWMCPNHAEHIIDEKLLTTARLSERIKLWDQCGRRLDQNGVKIQFLQKVKTTSNGDDEDSIRSKTRIPESIKFLYRNPQHLLSEQYCDVVAADSEVQQEFERQRLIKAGLTPPTFEEQKHWLTGLVSLQSNIAEYMVSEPSVKQEVPIGINSSVSNWMDSEAYAWKSVRKVEVKDEKCLSAKIEPELTLSDSERTESLVKDLKSSHVSLDSTLLNSLDEKLIRTLALQQLKHLTRNSETVVTTRKQENDYATCNSMTIRTLGISKIKARASLCPVYVNSEAFYRPIQEPFSMTYRTLTIGTSSDSDVGLSSCGHCNFSSPRHAAIYFDEDCDRYELINYSVHGTYVNGVLYCADFAASDTQVTVHSPRKGQGMTTIKRKRKYKSSKIGKKSVKKKPVISSLTGAAIKSSLESRTKVLKAPAKPTETKQVTVLPPVTEQVMCASVHSDFKPCKCQTSASMVISDRSGGWEGPALLNHGSHIRIGCAQFVFSIISHVNPDNVLLSDGDFLPPGGVALSCASTESVKSEMLETKAKASESLDKPLGGP
ncbi:PHD finger protein 12 [Halotydeus destructor]|nr:PHD finger protein 12 [Halotydeus destructor]